MWCIVYMWVYVHVMVCRDVGFRLFSARRGSTMGYAISLVWYPCGLAMLSQMTWWQSCKANKETSAANLSFFSTAGAKNMTKSSNGGVWKQWTREKVLGFNLKREPVYPHRPNGHVSQSGPDGAIALHLCLQRSMVSPAVGDGAQNSDVTKKTKMTPR